MASSVITRFAPSPTGFLHIGGARTALFNWLYAKHFGGKMLLRIEDTDRERSTPAAVNAILDGLKWLGLEWDGEAISQFARAARHKEIAESLVQNGKAYYCYATPEELQAMREEAKAKGLPPRYNGLWRDRLPNQAPQDRKPVIRIKAPQEGYTHIEDKVQGTIRFPNKDIDDFIILRSDGTPTYMLAVVVDDHDMGITHIIRGDDHLTNAARQAILYRALDWPMPVLFHIPLIHGADGAKLSKRHGALGLEAYRDMGYLPAALKNYLVRLGWSHGDDEIITQEDMISWFDGSKINKGAARFDLKKLDAINAHYLRALPEEALVEALLSLVLHMPDAEPYRQKIQQKYPQIVQAIPGLKPRVKTLKDLFEGLQFLLCERPLPIEEKAQSLLTADALELLRGLVLKLEQTPWSHEALETVLKSYCEEKGIKLSTLAQPLRIALTGKTSSPGIFDVLLVLGQQESLSRIKEIICQQPFA